MTPWFDSFRAQMPVSRRWAYFDHAAVAPLPEPARLAITHWLHEATEEGDVGWPRWAKRVEEVRHTAARMIGADTAEIALLPNTTAGINLVAEGFPWQPGDNVVTLANEFPSNIYPWMNLAARGVETRLIPVDAGRVDLDRLAASLDGRTRIVSVSWVGYASGWRINPGDVAELAHRHGALFFLDAIQGLGVFPLDVRQAGVDFLAADGHKWLLGPEGAGIFFVGREHLARLRPLGVGWHSVAQGTDFSRVELNLRADAARYEGGSQNMAGMIGLGASLDLLASSGHSSQSSPIAQRALEIADYAVQRLQAVGCQLFSPHAGDNRSSIVTWDMPGQSPAKIREALLAAGVVTSCRGGGVRISPHTYNTPAEIDLLVDVLKSRQ